MKQTLLITGGHLTPALSTIDVIRKVYPAWHIAFVGRRVALEGETALSEEYRIITAKKIPFYPLIAGRLKREGGLGALFSLLKVPVGFFQALWYVLTLRPMVIVSFGGYVALPVVISGWLLHIPIITHEQTRRPGLANRIIARCARVTCISFSDGSTGLHGKLVYTGLPIRESVFYPPKSLLFTLPKEKRPLLLIVGGSTGSVSINAVVYEVLPKLLESYTVIHQVGRISLGLVSNSSDHYIQVPYLSESDYSWALHNATIVIGRSGANTVMEIAAVGAIALFVPLPWAAENEQYYNALFLKEAGTCEILLQNDLSARTLIHVVNELHDTVVERKMRAKRIARQIPRDGAARLIKVIYDVTSS